MHAYVTVVRRNGSNADVLLAQKNIYLPPHGRYQFATVGRNAVQYVVPGGAVGPGEQPADAALRELTDLGVKLAPAALAPLCADATDTFFQAANPPGVDVDAINLAINEGRTGSLAYNHVRWFPVEMATCALGNKPEYQQLPWVSAQLMRALNAGFARDLITSRANASHLRYARGLAQLLLDVLSPKTAPPTLGPVVTSPSP
ncbi:MAG: NUDIX hydrolase [Myxococcales bacterium]|nr:NUDIX hydrolase [Myxococcales bacterium]